MRAFATLGILLVITLAFLPRRAVAEPGGIQTDKSLPRGIRNNNPGNLRDVGIPWRGLVGRDDQHYAIFDTPLNGIRAMARDILTGFTRDNENTVRKIISEYSPESDNNPTNAYINFVSARLGVGPDEPLDYDTHIKPLIKAIIHFENGMQPYSETLIDEAIKAAR